MAEDARKKASVDALKAIYYVIVGLAVTEALSRAFVSNGSFLGWQILEEKYRPGVLLLLALLVSITRFVHGASLHLETVQGGRFKSLCDYVSFMLHAALFYMMALCLGRPFMFAGCFALLCACDGLWLGFLRMKKYLYPLSATERQWLQSDIVVCVLLAGTIALRANFGAGLGSWAVTAIAIGATIFDYWKNHGFYFPDPPVSPPDSGLSKGGAGT